MEVRKRWALFLSILCLSTHVPNTAGQWQGEAQRMLDGMEWMMTGGTEYDREFLARLWPCMDKTNPRLREANDKAWYGMVTYSDNNGQPGDEWGECLDELHCVKYFEQNTTQQLYHNVTIYEPCNYASNMVFYRVAVTICDHQEAEGWLIDSESVRALTEVYANHAMGSGFWHGSHTLLGNIFDNLNIFILSWISYQASLPYFPGVQDSAVIYDLQLEPRNNSAVDVNDIVTNMFLNEHVNDWGPILVNIDMPNYYLTFGAIVIQMLSLTVDDDTADRIIEALAQLFDYPDEEYEFMTTYFIPEMRNSTNQMDLGPAEVLHLKGDFISALIKLLYAFLWQEWIVADNPNLLLPEVNQRGNEAIPTVNAFANALNEFPIYDQDLQNGINCYSGSEWCNDWDPHSKWHQEAGAGLTDLVFLADYIVYYTQIGAQRYRDNMGIDG